MLLLKACPHCRGDLVFEQDRACGYFTCVQCGHILSTAQEQALGYRAIALGPLHARAGSRRPRRTTRARNSSPCRTGSRGAAPRQQLELAKSSAG
jgi:hypothetical protein